MQRVPVRAGGYSLDLDSTIFERYGRQEGSLKGHNPRKHGRPSHHPVLAVLAEAHFILHGWLRSGNCGSSRGVVEFLEEALALWGQRQTIRLVRADSGFFDDKLLSFLEQRCLPYMVVTRLTKWVQREAQRIQHWTELDANYAAGEFRLKLHGWTTERRFVVIRERVRETRASVGRKLIDVPGYTFRIFVTSRLDAPEVIWRKIGSCFARYLRYCEGARWKKRDVLKPARYRVRLYSAVVILRGLIPILKARGGARGYCHQGRARPQS